MNIRSSRRPFFLKLSLICLLTFTLGTICILGIIAPAYSKEKKHKGKKGPNKDSKQVNVPAIPLVHVRDLVLKEPLGPGKKAFVSAASAIVKVQAEGGDQYYLVSDDENHLFSFTLKDPYLSSHQLLKETLPVAKDKRKSEKPDFESLIYLSKQEWPPFGAFVAWPSGSSPLRMKAVVVPLEKEGRLGEPIISNILPLAYQIQSDVNELNIEGLVVRDGKVYLFQRGNSKKGKNGIVEMPFDNWIKGTKEGTWGGKIKFQSIKMGTMAGVKLTFADAIWTKYGLLALASAEDSISSFADGAIYGTVLARIVGDKAEILAKFDPVTKLEGMTATETEEGLELLLVEDADNPDKAGRLFKASVSSSLLESIKAK